MVGLRPEKVALLPRALVIEPTPRTPKTEGICDRCGKELILRDDDKPETVKNRLEVYHKQTQPLIDFYSAKGILKTVDGTVDMKEVFAAIVAILSGQDSERQADVCRG